MSAGANNRVLWVTASVTGAALVFGAVLWRSWLSSSVIRARIVQAPVIAPAPPVPPVDYAPPDPTGNASLVGTTSTVSDEAVRLQLFATFPGKNSHEGTAVLGTDKMNPQTYGAGSVLASGAVIEEIFRDYVVLRINGTAARLYRAGNGNTRIDDAALLATTVGGPGFSDRPLLTLPSSREEFSDIVRPKLVFDEEKVTGFEIAAGRRRGDLTALGLEPGDVVRSIEGRPVAADADWQRISKVLRTGGSIVLGIERKGDLLSISMDAGQINKSEVTAMTPPLPPNS
jgi:general secretion pathway protein C